MFLSWTRRPSAHPADYRCGYQHRAGARGQDPHRAERHRPAHALGIPEPKVALLSAVETVNTKIKSTLDAAALCKMADRGQITGGILDGPLAFGPAVKRQGRQDQGAGFRRSRARADIWSSRIWKAAICWPSNWNIWRSADGRHRARRARPPPSSPAAADSAKPGSPSCAVAVLLHYAEHPVEKA